MEFYLRRLGPIEFEPPREQSFPAAVGLAFDSYVKTSLSADLTLACPSLAFLLSEIRPEHKDRATGMAGDLLAGYKFSGAYRRLLEERPEKLFLDWEDFAPGTTVPVRCKLDALTLYGGRLTAHDWKVFGAGRSEPPSPTPGYTTAWDTKSPGQPSGPHEKAILPLDAIDEDWATQLAMYGWAAGFPISEMVGSIDQVIPCGQGRVRTAQYRARVTEAFQRRLIVRLEAAWLRIKEERVVPEEMLGMSPADLRVML